MLKKWIDCSNPYKTTYISKRDKEYIRPYKITFLKAYVFFMKNINEKSSKEDVIKLFLNLCCYLEKGNETKRYRRRVNVIVHDLLPKRISKVMYFIFLVLIIYTLRFTFM